MPKLKNKKAAAKRFSFTATGKVRGNFAYNNHFRRNRSTEAKLSTRGNHVLCDSNQRTVKQYLYLKYSRG